MFSCFSLFFLYYKLSYKQRSDFNYCEQPLGTSCFGEGAGSRPRRTMIKPQLPFITVVFFVFKLKNIYSLEGESSSSFWTVQLSVLFIPMFFFFFFRLTVSHTGHRTFSYFIEQIILHYANSSSKSLSSLQLQYPICFYSYFFILILRLYRETILRVNFLFFFFFTYPEEFGTRHFCGRLAADEIVVDSIFALVADAGLHVSSGFALAGSRSLVAGATLPVAPPPLLCAVFGTSWVFANEPELCLLLGCCLLRSRWLLDADAESFRRFVYPSLPEPNEPVLLRYWARFTELVHGFCKALLALPAFDVGSVTVLAPPDNRRTLLVEEASVPPALSDTLLFRLLFAISDRGFPPKPWSISFIWGYRSTNISPLENDHFMQY